MLLRYGDEPERGVTEAAAMREHTRRAQQR